MNSLVVLLGLVVAASAHSLSIEESKQTEWMLYKRMHGKTYDNAQVEALRRQIFHQNKLQIDTFNQDMAPKLGYTMGLSHLSDHTQAELDRLNGLRLPANETRNSPEAQRFLDELLNDTTAEIPDELDWRKVPGRVSRVKDQGQCGSCWAFASTGALEGQQLVRGPKLAAGNVTGRSVIELSEQNLVDCVEDNKGCDGGWMSFAYATVAKEGGIDSEHDYPYTALDGHCSFDKTKSVFTDNGFVMLKKGDEEVLRQTVARFGPVSVAILATETFFKYASGVYSEENCPTEQPNHAVLVVGYGFEETPAGRLPYWLVKNSWADSWGDHGYIKMRRNQRNNCGIASYATIPYFK